MHMKIPSVTIQGNITAMKYQMTPVLVSRVSMLTL